MKIVTIIAIQVFNLLFLSTFVLPRVRKRDQEEDMWVNFDDMDSDIIDQEFKEEKKFKEVNDPDMNKDPCEIIRARGFVCQPHHPVTNDGYILTLFRIINPYTVHFNDQSIMKRPILLMHGMMGSSADFVIGSGSDYPRPPTPKGLPYVPRTNNLGFELSNHGYGQ